MHVWEYSTAYLSFPVLSKLWKERAQAELSSGNSVVYPARARANPHRVKHNTSTCHPVMQGPVGVAEVHALWWRGLVKLDTLVAHPWLGSCPFEHAAPYLFLGMDVHGLPLAV